MCFRLQCVLSVETRAVSAASFALIKYRSVQLPVVTVGFCRFYNGFKDEQVHICSLSFVAAILLQ